jgi:hypothetical protein
VGSSNSATSGVVLSTVRPLLLTLLAALEPSPDLAGRIPRVLSGDEEPMAALYVAMHALASGGAGTVHGYVAEATQLDAAPIPDDLLRVPKGAVSVAVTHHRAKGAAWAQYVVFYLAATPSETNWL